MILLSPDFKDGDFLDEKFSLSNDYGFGCSGRNIRPHLKWDNISEKVVELAITIFDPDAPTGCGFWHWIMVGVNKNIWKQMMTVYQILYKCKTILDRIVMVVLVHLKMIILIAIILQFMD